MTSKHSFEEVTRLNDNLSMVHFKRHKEHHAYNIINAFMILEKFKDLVYKKYDELFAHFDGNIRLCQGETDSLRIQIYDPDNNFVCKMKQLSSKIDFSRLPPSHVLYSSALKNQLGAWKLAQLNIVEIVSLKIRLYSYYTKCDKCYNIYHPKCDYCAFYNRNKSVAEGFKPEMRNSMTHEFFRSLLFDLPSEDPQRSHIHLLDDRRYFTGHSFSSRPHGHYRNRGL